MDKANNVTPTQQIIALDRLDIEFCIEERQDFAEEATRTQKQPEQTREEGVQAGWNSCAEKPQKSACAISGVFCSTSIMMTEICES